MVKYKLKSRLPLNNYKVEINSIKISALSKREIYSLAIKLGKDERASNLIGNIYNCPMPKPGKAEISYKYSLKVLRLSTDQLFIVFDSQHLHEIKSNFPKLAEAFYITEQTDAWSGVKVSGKRVFECLERLCPINLSIETFKVHSFARTIMEHLNTLIIRSKRNEFELFTNSSSENSFLHAIETSAKNI